MASIKERIDNSTASVTNGKDLIAKAIVNNLGTSASKTETFKSLSSKITKGNTGVNAYGFKKASIDKLTYLGRGSMTKFCNIDGRTVNNSLYLVYGKVTGGTTYKSTIEVYKCSLLTFTTTLESSIPEVRGEFNTETYDTNYRVATNLESNHPNMRYLYFNMFRESDSSGSTPKFGYKYDTSLKTLSEVKYSSSTNYGFPFIECPSYIENKNIFYINTYMNSIMKYTLFDCNTNTFTDINFVNFSVNSKVLYNNKIYYNGTDSKDGVYDITNGTSTELSSSYLPSIRKGIAVYNDCIYSGQKYQFGSSSAPNDYAKVINKVRINGSSLELVDDWVSIRDNESNIYLNIYDYGYIFDVTSEKKFYVIVFKEGDYNVLISNLFLK